MGGNGSYFHGIQVKETSRIDAQVEETLHWIQVEVVYEQASDVLMK